MHITIQKGGLEHLNDCVQALVDSELGRLYFTGEGSAERAVREGLVQRTLYVALADGACAGFAWYLPKGAFHSFPYLHIIAISAPFRGKGFGRQLLAFIESLAFAEADKLFLVVADFNPRARRFYEKAGYRLVGEIPDLYRRGITECLLMKKRTCRNDSCRFSG